MMKTSCSETKRLREAERKKKEKESANRLKYHYANRENINRKRREKTAPARQLKAAQQSIDTSTVGDGIDDSSKPKKYDWALYKRRQRAKAKEELAKKENKKCKRKRKEGQVSAAAFPSRMSNKRRIDLVKSHLPETPEKKVDVLAAIIESPTRRNGLENNGIIPSAVSEEAQVAVAVMSEARDAINAMKDQRSDDSRAATQTALGFLCGEKVKTKRMKTKVSKMLNINRKRISKAFNHRTKVLKSKKSCWTYTERRTRSDAVPTEHRKLAHDFLSSPDISRTTPNKKDIVRKRLAPKTYVTHPKQILEKTQTEAFLEFKQKYPQIKMGQRTFESCKPFYIATRKSQDRISCCCRIHVETRMVFQSCMEFRRKLDQLPDEYTAYEHLSDLVNQTLCPKQNGKDYHESNCLLRKCDKINVELIGLKF